MATQYSFVTNWKFKASRKQVWDMVYNSLDWPGWWKGVYSVIEIKKNNADGIGGVREYTWKSALPYKLTFTMKLTEKEELKRLKGISFGELEGTGEWLLTESKGIVHVQYNWNVTTTKKWMNSLAFLLKPLFRFNHNVVMHWGAISLAKKLKADLILG